MSRSAKRLMSIVVLVLVSLALVRAVDQQWRDRETAFRNEGRQQMQKLGLTPDQAKVKFPTPEITLVASGCVVAGSTGDIVLNGRFAPGSKLFIENDAFEVLKESPTPTQFRATVKAPADIGPVRATVAVISPVSGIRVTQYSGILVGGRFEWTMQASNGWKITARPQRTAPCPEGRGSEDEWDLAFYRAGETKPFQTPTGRLTFSQSSTPIFRFSVEANAGAGMGDYQSLMKRMSDPKLADAERDRIMKQLEAISQKMSDPKYMQQMVADQEKRKQDFGCENIELRGTGAGAFAGTLACSEKVGRRLDVKATLALMK